MKTSNDTIGNQTRDLPAAVPQPTAPERAPMVYTVLTGKQNASHVTVNHTCNSSFLLQDLWPCLSVQCTQEKEILILRVQFVSKFQLSCAITSRLYKRHNRIRRHKSSKVTNTTQNIKASHVRYWLTFWHPSFTFKF